MKADIHPTYYPDAVVTCACGNSWITGSTMKEIHTDVCSQCHPFFTGEQRIVDTEGQVDRFYRKLQARQQYLDEAEAREAERISPERPIMELELGKRATDSLAKAEITQVGQALEKFALGDDTLLAIDGFGRKSLADLKKRLRSFGYIIPEAGEEITV
jgi:large subunit ribosomal protein L31